MREEEQMGKKFTTLNVLVIALAVLVVCVPIGLIATGTAFGEWGSDELEEMNGYVPTGLQSLSDVWSAPIPDYDLPGEHDSLPSQAPGYYISAIIGVLVCAGIAYGLGKVAIKRND